MQFQVKMKKAIHRVLRSQHDLSNITNIATVNGSHDMSRLPINTILNIPSKHYINYFMRKLNNEVNVNSNRTSP